MHLERPLAPVRKKIKENKLGGQSNDKSLAGAWRGAPLEGHLAGWTGGLLFLLWWNIENVLFPCAFSPGQEGLAHVFPKVAG